MPANVGAEHEVPSTSSPPPTVWKFVASAATSGKARPLALYLVAGGRPARWPRCKFECTAAAWYDGIPYRLEKPPDDIDQAASEAAPCGVVPPTTVTHGEPGGKRGTKHMAPAAQFEPQPFSPATPWSPDETISVINSALFEKLCVI
eukprot:3479249-Prymnesium_polylepis.2